MTKPDFNKVDTVPGFFKDYNPGTGCQNDNLTRGNICGFTDMTMISFYSNSKTNWKFMPI